MDRHICAGAFLGSLGSLTRGGLGVRAYTCMNPELIGSLVAGPSNLSDADWSVRPNTPAPLPVKDTSSLAP